MKTGSRIIKKENANLYAASMALRAFFEKDGYETTMVTGINGFTVSIKKGGLFKKVCGCQTSFNIMVQRI